MSLLFAVAASAALSSTPRARRWHPETVTCARRAGESETTPDRFVIRIDDYGEHGALELADESVQGGIAIVTGPSGTSEWWFNDQKHLYRMPMTYDLYYCTDVSQARMGLILTDDANPERRVVADYDCIKSRCDE